MTLKTVKLDAVKLLNITNAILAVFLLSACSLSKTRPEKDTLRFNLSAEPPSLDWAVTTDSTSFDVISNLMVGLSQYTNDLKCVPACAQSWDILDDGKRYIFHLRPDILWTDGRKLTAHDFEYAWKRLLNPKTAAQYAYFLYDIENAFEYNTGKITDANLIGVHALDDLTLEVKLKKPAAYFIYLTAFGPSYPQRQDIVERWGDRWTEPAHIVTNGPFKLTKWEHEYKIELAANDTFFEGPPHLKKIKMFMVPEQATAFGLYENNQLDYIDNRSFATPDVERCCHSPEYHNIPLLRANYIGFNVSKKPFDDVRVRKAVAMAIDKTVFPRILRRGERPQNCWIPPTLLGYAPDSGLSFNPEKARKLLADAGYAEGKNFPDFDLLYPNREDARLVVETIQDELKRNLNIHANLVNQEWKVYLSTLHQDPPPVFRNSWGADYPDPETFMNLFTSYNGNNNTCWKNSTYDNLIAQAEGERDTKLRGEIYQKADRLLCRDQVPIIPTYLSTQNLMIKPWVHGMAFNAIDIQFFRNVTVDNSWSATQLARRGDK